MGDALSEGFVGDQNLFDGGESFRRYVSLLDKAHVAVEGCMGELGFDFIPQPIITENELSLRTAYLDVDLSESQFADQWGFGITTSQLWDIPEVDPANFEDAFNPTAGLSDTDAVAYIEALNGTSESNPGCVQLQIDILSENGRALEARFEDVQQALELFADSTEIEAFYQDWAGCMMERGFTYTSPLSAYRDINSQMQALRQSEDFTAIDNILRPDEIDAATATVACGGTVRDLLPAELEAAWTRYSEPLLG